MSLSKESIRSALARVVGVSPGTDLVSGGHLLWSSVCETYASIKVQLPAGSSKDQVDRVARESRDAVASAAASAGTALDSFIVEFVDDNGTLVHTARFGGMNARSGSADAAAAQKTGSASEVKNASAPSAAGHTPIPGLTGGRSGGGPLPGVDRVIAVGAGKGGVGKSTVALNIAVGLARQGKAVGLLDADIYGPSMPTMLGLDGLEAVVLEGHLQPFFTHGVKCMTIGKLVDANKPLIWRGPMAHGAFKQLLEQTRWGELDYLIIDLPPGTGDISLSMAQMLQLTGAVVVCTPQKVAQDDAVRAAGMFKQLNVEVLGVVENMSSFVGDDGKVYEIFGKGGAEAMAQRLGVPFLGAIPITMSLRQNSDSGDPTANFTGKDAPGTRLASALAGVVRQLESQAALAQMRSGAARPRITIS